MFVKHDITRYIYPARGDMKTLVSLVKATVPQGNTTFRTKLKLAIIVRTKAWPARTAESVEEGVVRLDIQ